MQLRLQGSQLLCLDHDGGVRWSLPLNDLVIIAEYTTDQGPQLDDYFLVFCTIEKGQAVFASCSFYATGRDEALSVVGEKLGASLNLLLCGSTEWNSNIVWPTELAGQKYFRFQEAQPKFIRGRMREMLLGPTSEIFLSEPVQLSPSTPPVPVVVVANCK